MCLPCSLVLGTTVLPPSVLWRSRHPIPLGTVYNPLDREVFCQLETATPSTSHSPFLSTFLFLSFQSFEQCSLVFLSFSAGLPGLRYFHKPSLLRSAIKLTWFKYPPFLLRSRPFLHLSLHQREFRSVSLKPSPTPRNNGRPPV